jgi:hypothetical protein
MREWPLAIAAIQKKFFGVVFGFDEPGCSVWTGREGMSEHIYIFLRPYLCIFALEPPELPLLGKAARFNGVVFVRWWKLFCSRARSTGVICPRCWSEVIRGEEEVQLCRCTVLRGFLEARGLWSELQEAYDREVIRPFPLAEMREGFASGQLGEVALAWLEEKNCWERRRLAG